VAELTQLSVWPVSQQPARVQRRSRYLAESTAHPGKMLPELARTIIGCYSEPGQLVLDPMCGIGTTLVEAIHLGRDAIGVEFEPRWATLAARNVLLAREHGAVANALALRGDARRLGKGLLDELAGSVALILTSPPYGPSTHGHVRKHEDRVEKLNTYYSRNPDNLAHLPARPTRKRGESFEAAFATILAGCMRMLAPGGHLVLTVRPFRARGALVDLPGATIELAQSVGLTLTNRHVALLCGLRGSGLVSRTSFFQIQHQRKGAIPRMLLIAHEDVLVFTKTARTPSSTFRGERR
jgi:SAM-dependent methyltransferase